MGGRSDTTACRASGSETPTSGVEKASSEGRRRRSQTRRGHRSAPRAERERKRGQRRGDETVEEHAHGDGADPVVVDAKEDPAEPDATCGDVRDRGGDVVVERCECTCPETSVELRYRRDNHQGEHVGGSVARLGRARTRSAAHRAGGRPRRSRRRAESKSSRARPPTTRSRSQADRRRALAPTPAARRVASPSRPEQGR